ncbi:unnamed protein product [Mycena citricolor]|uniref:Uncharacterized protein n=1 Tax=Mycena citricolor TaxID=2018698 RepID=A0AAD2HH17_9AGAR|nr:unnamed protein product [Mycena citricolor]
MNSQQDPGPAAGTRYGTSFSQPPKEIMEYSCAGLWRPSDCRSFDDMGRLWGYQRDQSPGTYTVSRMWASHHV